MGASLQPSGKLLPPEHSGETVWILEAVQHLPELVARVHEGPRRMLGQGLTSGTLSTLGPQDPVVRTH